MFELNNFSAIKIGIASPEKIREWSYGEVTKPETINYRTQKPERDGLFCERIFGPTKDWECHCGKYKRIRYKGVVCDKCGVEVTRSKVRRERMGHIELATPVSHIWFFRGVPSKIGTTLDLTVKVLESVLYYVNWIVLDPKNTDLTFKQILSDKEYREAIEKYGSNSFRAGMGADAIRELLKNIDVEKEVETLRKESQEAKSGQKKLKAVRRLETMESFLKSGNKPEWMIMEVLPVIPPDLRPIVQLEGGKVATSDLNDLYRRVINRNNRLKKLMELGAPEIIIRNEKRMLQEAVDSLIDNGKRGKAVTSSRHELKSIAGILRGKQGRFRLNLLGKRVDYSGRTVITAGPELKMYQCGLSKEMALELFRPFVLHRLVELNESTNIKSAKRLIEREKPVVWSVLEEVVKEHPVFLNRAPTLHRLGIQAFEPVLIEGKSIQLHPLVCGGFNADFDGDQMAIHVPISTEACTEARMLMLSTNNIIKPSDGRPVCSPTQDVVLGSYYLTILRDGTKGEGGVYKDEEEALTAHFHHELDLQAKIKVRRKSEFNGEIVSDIIETSVGKILFNRVIPQCLGYVDRSKRENVNKFEIDFPVGKNELVDITLRAFNNVDNTTCVTMLYGINSLGYKYATLASISISVFDMHIPDSRESIIKEAQAKAMENDKQYRRGLITLQEKKSFNFQVWNQAMNDVTKAVVTSWDKFNPIKIIADSKARASDSQLVQLAGMRGIMSSSSGTLDVPVKGNFRLGLSNLEYFMSCLGGRKSLTDTALKTADSGYLTRRLVDVSQDVVITEDDCFESLGEKPRGITVSEIVSDYRVIQTLEQRIFGRVALNDIIDPKTKQVIVKANELITDKLAKQVAQAGIKSVDIRSVLTCRCRHGICAKCYGKNMTSDKLASVGDPVGIIAAQSIGEPGTQLTMRTFHTGGIASASDITKGLPRVEELFEARRPKVCAIVSEVSGKVTIRKVDKRDEILVKTADDVVSYLIPYGLKLIVKNGDVVDPGTPLTAGSLYPNDILATRGIKGVQDYIINEVISVYADQGVSLSAKHVEIIARQMLRYVKVESSGDTALIPGDIVDVFKYEAATEQALNEGKVPPTARRVLLSITRSSLSAESFLSSASFQETASVLTSAAIKGKVDHLVGLKENIIIGKIIPAGTGLPRYRNLEPVRAVTEEPVLEQVSEVVDQ